MSDPIARLHLDDRREGPANCDVCEKEVETLLLTIHGEFVCPTCGTPMPGFEAIANLFCSASIMTATEIAEFKKTEGS